MNTWDALPDAPLTAAGPLGAAFVTRGLSDLRAAGRYLQTLPYGRTRDRSDFAAVLREGKGTCSTKHALLAAVAAEEGIPLVLTLGIYAMHERNTPGVGSVLARHRLASVPEAHCCVTYQSRRIDVTRSGAEPAEPIVELLHEESIVPAQIADHKVDVHRQFIRHWTRTRPEEAGRRDADEIWRIREECIAALAQ
jgi:hypothetical protein